MIDPQVKYKLPAVNPLACGSLKVPDRRTDRQTDGQTDGRTDGEGHDNTFRPLAAEGKNENFMDFWSRPYLFQLLNFA